MKIGVISDTHNYFDPKLPQIFKGVDHILHGGDIGSEFIIFQLQQIAPVTAVTGNTDEGLSHKETAVVEIGGRKYLIHHIVEHPRALAGGLEKRIAREKPDVVVFGHTHQPFCQMFEGVLYFNPGYSGKPRFGMERSVAILSWDGNNDIRPKFVPLP